MAWAVGSPSPLGSCVSACVWICYHQPRFLVKLLLAPGVRGAPRWARPGDGIWPDMSAMFGCVRNRSQRYLRPPSSSEYVGRQVSEC